ncbi:Hypothetical predicted protein [Paramuricea clavata]|uniref:Uncharacterized protein n=1 Tax=Paramuricea clavata TaxID=317549 RepID=A0A6S7HGG9_PARCT|nr:Hypothetical predicted protein [Paramuricea clavata]
MITLVSLASHLSEGKINLPAGGDILTSLHGAQVKIRWSFDDPISSVGYRLWSFSNNGKKVAESLATITDDGFPVILNSSLPGIAIQKPATLILKMVDLRYNGTYHFTLFALGVVQSDVTLFIAGRYAWRGNVKVYFLLIEEEYEEQLTTDTSGTASQLDSPTTKNLSTAGSQELGPSTGIATNRNVPTIKNSVTGNAAGNKIHNKTTVIFWHIVVALVSGIFIGIILSYIVVYYRCRSRNKQIQSKLAQQPPQGDSVYQELDLNKMGNKECYQPLKVNSAGDEAIYENELEPTYTKLNQTRDAENTYQTLA